MKGPLLTDSGLKDDLRIQLIASIVNRANNINRVNSVNNDNSANCTNYMRIAKIAPSASVVYQFLVFLNFYACE
jgi:hypothetical protein